MKFNPQNHHRASTRLIGYDYSRAGAYFITAVTYQRERLFGEILDGAMNLNRRGEIVWEEWFRSTRVRKEIQLYPEEFIVMPNHIHGIVWIMEAGSDASSPPGTTEGADGVPGDSVGATGRSPLRPIGPSRKSLGSLMAGFKSSVTKRIRDELNETGIWQRNYHDRIIRDDRELDAIRRYIQGNPLNWVGDEENPGVGR